MPGQQRVDEAVGQTARRGREVVEEAASRAQEVAQAERQRWANEVDGVARALGHAADSLRSDGRDTIAQYTERAAEGVHRAGRMLRDRNPRELVRGVEDFARREPLMFLGGALLLGAAVSRLLKNAAESVSDEDEDDRHERRSLGEEERQRLRPAEYTEGGF
jgi:hypothetical protein